MALIEESKFKLVLKLLEMLGRPARFLIPQGWQSGYFTQPS